MMNPAFVLGGGFFLCGRRDEETARVHFPYCFVFERVVRKLPIWMVWHALSKAGDRRLGVLQKDEPAKMMSTLPLLALLVEVGVARSTSAA